MKTGSQGIRSSFFQPCQARWREPLHPPQAVRCYFAFARGARSTRSSPPDGIPADIHSNWPSRLPEAAGLLAAKEKSPRVEGPCPSELRGSHGRRLGSRYRFQGGTGNHRFDAGKGLKRLLVRDPIGNPMGLISKYSRKSLKPRVFYVSIFMIATQSRNVHHVSINWLHCFTTMRS
jgi:hypothetical protein